MSADNNKTSSTPDKRLWYMQGCRHQIEVIGLITSVNVSDKIWAKTMQPDDKLSHT